MNKRQEKLLDEMQFAYPLIICTLCHQTNQAKSISKVVIQTVSVGFVKLQIPERFFDDEKVVVTKSGNVIDIMKMTVKSTALEDYRQLPNHEHLHLPTGEITKDQKADNKSESLLSLRKTLKDGRDRINAVFGNAENRVFGCLTYPDVMRDAKRLHDNEKAFMRAFRKKYHCVDNYCMVVEPQESGSFHLHFLVSFSQKTSLNNKDIKDIWREVLKRPTGHLITDIVDTRNVDNIGVYLGAYLTDTRAKDGKSKKGERLRYYPAGMQIFRFNRDAPRPIKTLNLRYKEAKSVYEIATPTYASTVKILSEDKKFLNSVTHEFYNTKRPKGK